MRHLFVVVILAALLCEYVETWAQMRQASLAAEPCFFHANANVNVWHLHGPSWLCCKEACCVTPCLKHIQQIMLVMSSNAVATMDLQPSYESSCGQTVKLTTARIVTIKTHQR